MLKLLLLVFAVCAAADGMNGNWPPIWPLPKSFTNSTQVFRVKATNFTFTSEQPSDFLAQAFNRYRGLIFPHAENPTEGIAELVVFMEVMDDSYPQMETNESYSLEIAAQDGKIIIRSRCVYGALRALETFSQLVRYDFNSKFYFIHGCPWLIMDEPRFAHRGLMLDVARHFHSPMNIMRLIDSLPYAKLNVLHLHISDTESFPLESLSFPNLWNSAFSESEKYTQADMAAIIQYGRLRGVRVVAEFDMPGHAGSWCVGYPGVCPKPDCTQPLNPAASQTYSLILSLLSEMTGDKSSQPSAPSGLFPDNTIHLGGDEVDGSCWLKTPSIVDWLKQQNFTADQAYMYFVKKVADIAISQGRRPIQWGEVFDKFGTNLDKRTIIHVNKDEATLAKAVSNGYNAILSNANGANSWSLDHLDVPWTAVYGNEPCAGINDVKQCAFVSGGEGGMWGENVDASDLENTIWPKLAAIAERLWSPREFLPHDANDAKIRMEDFRCLLNHRGVSAAPVNNANARSAPPGPGSCFAQ